MAQTRILVVDDQAGVLESVGRLLSGLGYDVATVESGVEALEYLQQHEVGAVLTDIDMPEMSGLEVISSLQSRHPGVQLLAMSGYGDTCSGAIGVLGRGRVLRKPFVLVDLLSLLERNGLWPLVSGGGGPGPSHPVC